MTTLTILVIIIILLGNLFILYMPFSKKEKAGFCGAASLFLGFWAIGYNAQTDHAGSFVYETIATAPTINAKQCLMARFDITETELRSRVGDEAKTAIEVGVYALVSLALVLGALLPSAVRNNDDKDAKAVYLLLIALNVTALAFLLSLAYGLQLRWLPWLKNKTVSESISPKFSC